MNKLIIASAAAALMLGISSPAFAAMTAADCQTLFQRADLNKDGSLQADEAKVFLEAMNQAQVKPKDASLITQDEFTTACQKDAFANIDPATIGTATTEQPAASTDQAASTESTTTTTDSSATTDEPTSGSTTVTTDQSGTGTTATTDQSASTSEPTTMEQAAEQPAEQALAVPTGIMASGLLGATVYSPTEENIGEVKDVLLSERGGQAIIDLGEKDVAVDLPHLKIATTSDGLKVMLDATKADLESLPAFAKQ